MKKKLLSIVAVVAVAVAAAWGFNQSSNDIALADMTLSNIEALAQPENGGNSCWMVYGVWECSNKGNNGCAPCGN